MKILTLLFFLVVSISAYSQNESIYAFNGNWKSIDNLEKAKYFLRTHQVSDTCWQFDYYNYKGPLIKTERFRDKQGQILNGDVFYYNNKGLLDSMGYYYNGKKDGEFVKFSSDSLKWRWKYIYRADSLIEIIDLEKLKKDSVILYKDEKESEYPGGAAGWARYLQKNLKYPERALNFNKQGQVRIIFIIDRDGNPTDINLSASVEYSLDEEALRIIRNSGKWEPAFQNGHHVKTYKVQPINFRLE